MGDRLANYALVWDDRLRTALSLQASAGAAVVAAPAAILGGLLGATLLGAASYRRSARRLARVLPPAPPPAGQGRTSVDVGPLHGVPPRAADVLTKAELVKLFVVPGIAAGALVATLGSICRWALDVESMDDLVRQLRWLCGNGPRPPQRDR